VLELLETQGIEALTKFITKVKAREESKAQQRLLNDVRFKEIEEKLKSCAEHPKIARLVQMIKERPAGEKFIVFSQYRDQVQVLHEAMQKEGLRSKPFMGKKDGFTQKEQAKTIEDFRKNEFDILVSTSIGEEGLDIPSVDNVVFYEPVPSEIRSIQRRGRAGRAKLGRMFGLIATGTRDQAFFWSAKKREEKMKRIVKKMSGREEEEFQKVWTNKNTGKESGELKDEEIKHAKEKSLKEKETDEKAQNKKQDENKKINSPEDKKQNESVDKKQGSDKTKNSSQDKKHKKGQYRLSDFE
jgi:Fanconi anemia group M protein